MDLRILASMARTNLDAQLADGIRVNLTTYLSSRQYNEAWVKGGNLSVNKLTMLGSPAIDLPRRHLRRLRRRGRDRLLTVHTS